TKVKLALGEILTCSVTHHGVKASMIFTPRLASLILLSSLLMDLPAPQSPTSPNMMAAPGSKREEATVRDVIIAFMPLAAPVAVRDLGQWEAQPAEVRQWFQKLMQPDIPTMPCCGEADAYWADSFEVDDGRYVAIITDERSDGPLGRPHRDVGERVVVPNNKIKWDEGNPTGHGIIFLGTNGQVYCYVPPGGV